MQKGQTQVLILAGIVMVLAVAGGIFSLGRVTAPKPQSQNVATSSPQPSPTPQPTPIPDETANWKTYTNTRGRYMLKYPSGWTVVEKDTGTLILPKSGEESEFFSSVQVLFWNNRSLEDFIQKGKEPTLVTIDGLKGRRMNGEVFVNQGTGIYQISLIEVAGGEQISDEIFNQILSTFRFD